MPAIKEQIQQIIAENNISSVADVYTLLKDSFKDILQELMETELDSTLGYVSNRFKFLMDCNGITLKSSSPDCCFLNLKYSYIRHLIRYTFATIMQSFFFSVNPEFVSSIIGSFPKPYTTTMAKSLSGNPHNLIGM